ncbi:MFS general substrate transporter [Hyaloscypha hepaticicola]|uniref:MFS general substrate transporter n=1 Tax=Hyaloscypha hepaticicola TaxID=2082293 RepID=A0A2J6PEJ3_9HELO|nr:MFS general substrate transporter [Hyaloscypha hepaticicola]
MALGVSAYLCSCFAAIYGKRLVFLFTTVLMIATCCWGAAANTYNSFLGARIMQGLGMGGFFALAGTASINDLFFVHQRGFRVGLWNFAVIVSVNITPIISGYIIVDLSWRWCFWILVITLGVLLDSVAALEKTHLGDGALPEIGTGSISQHASLWRRVLGLENLEIKDQSRIFRLCISPLLLLRHPAAVWGSLMWAVTFTWVIIQGAVATQIFGYSPLIGAALGTLFGGWSSDEVAKVLALRNNGVYEPEFRLLVIIPAFVTIVIRGFGLGGAISSELSPVICGVFLAFINFAVDKAGEAFGLAMLIKNAFAFGLTFMLNDYYADNGPRVFFFTWGALTVGVMLLTIPIYLFGKQIRAWADKNNIL